MSDEFPKFTRVKQAHLSREVVHYPTTDGQIYVGPDGMPGLASLPRSGHTTLGVASIAFPVSPDEIARQLEALKVEIVGITAQQSRRFDDLAETIRAGGYSHERLVNSLILATGKELDELARIAQGPRRVPGETDEVVRQGALREIRAWEDDGPSSDRCDDEPESER